MGFNSGFKGLINTKYFPSFYAELKLNLALQKRKRLGILKKEVHVQGQKYKTEEETSTLMESEHIF